MKDILVQPGKVPAEAVSYGKDFYAAWSEAKKGQLYAYSVYKDTSEEHLGGTYLRPIEAEDDFLLLIGLWKEGALFYLTLIELTEEQVRVMQQ